MYRNIDEIASEAIKQYPGLRKQQAIDITRTILNCIVEGVGSLTPGSSERVNLQNFGTFALKKIAAHKGHNPQTGAETQIPETLRVSFKPCSKFTQSVLAANGYADAPAEDAE